MAGAVVHKNPLTSVMEEAERLILGQEVELLSQFGIPLYTEVVGKYGKEAMAFPEDPEQVSPEQMQVLIDTHGEDAVDHWLMESLSAKYGDDVEEPE